MTAARKKPVNSRRKGANAELEFAKRLTELGHSAERGQQRRGGSESPDVLCPSLSWVHWEVKFYKDCQLFSPAMVATWDAQALADSDPSRQLACIAHRWNGSKQWWVRIVTPHGLRAWVTLEDFLTHVRPLGNPHEVQS